MTYLFIFNKYLIVSFIIIYVSEINGKLNEESVSDGEEVNQVGDSRTKRTAITDHACRYFYKQFVTKVNICKIKQTKATLIIH